MGRASSRKWQQRAARFRGFELRRKLKDIARYLALFGHRAEFRQARAATKV